MHKKNVMRICIGALVVTTMVLGIPQTLRSFEPDAWIEVNRHELPSDYATFRLLPREYQGHAFRAMSKAEKLQVMSGRLSFLLDSELADPGDRRIAQVALQRFAAASDLVNNGGNPEDVLNGVCSTIGSKPPHLRELFLPYGQDPGIRDGLVPWARAQMVSLAGRFNTRANPYERCCNCGYSVSACGATDCVTSPTAPDQGPCIGVPYAFEWLCLGGECPFACCGCFCLGECDKWCSFGVIPD